MPAQDPKPPNGCLCISPLCFLHRCLSCNFSAADKSNQLVPLTQPKALKKLSFVFELPAFHLNALRNFGPHPNCWACLLPPCLYRLVSCNCRTAGMGEQDWTGRALAKIFRVLLETFPKGRGGSLVSKLLTCCISCVASELVGGLGDFETPLEKCFTIGAGCGSGGLEVGGNLLVICGFSGSTNCKLSQKGCRKTPLCCSPQWITAEYRLHGRKKEWLKYIYIYINKEATPGPQAFLYWLYCDRYCLILKMYAPLGESLASEPYIIYTLALRGGAKFLTKTHVVTLDPCLLESTANPKKRDSAPRNSAPHSLYSPICWLEHAGLQANYKGLARWMARAHLEQQKANELTRMRKEKTRLRRAGIQLVRNSNPNHTRFTVPTRTAFGTTCMEGGWVVEGCVAEACMGRRGTESEWRKK
ncbi:putative signal peptide protein [Puccinia sorghi]|uniref:Putative signal peptide protein n=1 Tax=Puccinia sorghi TaxID=27349 RepID=A0A0L6URC7_9BASI|nr:putative signal peptide protein [Puccinia sorghi]